MKDRNFLIWLHEMMEKSNKESLKYDCFSLHKLRAVISATPAEQETDSHDGCSSIDALKEKFAAGHGPRFGSLGAHSNTGWCGHGRQAVSSQDENKKTTHALNNTLMRIVHNMIGNGQDEKTFDLHDMPEGKLIFPPEHVKIILY